MPVLILDDQAAIVDFNARLAFETEHEILDLDVLSRGGALALADPDRLRYGMAEDADLGRGVFRALYNHIRTNRVRRHRLSPLRRSRQRPSPKHVLSPRPDSGRV